jgi:membrane associated rhomboid family serine protease
MRLFLMGKFDFGSVQKLPVESGRANLPIIGLSSVMSAICGLLFVIETYGVPATSFLALSPSTPWGIFTLMFVHNGWDHLSGNISMIWAWTALVFLLDSVHSQAERRRKAVFFVVVVVASAVVAHATWFVIAMMSNNGPFSSVGASGLTFAFGGAVLGFAVMNATHAIPRRGIAEQKKRANFVMMINFLVAGMIMILVLSNPAAFIAKGQGNHFGHGVAFIFGLFGILLKENFIPMMKSTAMRRQQ